MFMLVYLAMFGTKKGSIVAYESSWALNFNTFSSGLSLSTKKLRTILCLKVKELMVLSVVDHLKSQNQ